MGRLSTRLAGITDSNRLFSGSALQRQADIVDGGRIGAVDNRAQRGGCPAQQGIVALRTVLAMASGSRPTPLVTISTGQPRLRATSALMSNPNTDPSPSRSEPMHRMKSHFALQRLVFLDDAVEKGVVAAMRDQFIGLALHERQRSPVIQRQAKMRQQQVDVLSSSSGARDDRAEDADFVSAPQNEFGNPDRNQRLAAVDVGRSKKRLN